MIRRILLTALAGAILLLAADPTGTWTGDQPGPGGNTYSITFKLKADGGKVTGTMGGEQFEQPIQNGEIHGDDISFTVHLDFGDGIDLKYTGKVAADNRNRTKSTAATSGRRVRQGARCTYSRGRSSPTLRVLSEPLPGAAGASLPSSANEAS